MKTELPDFDTWYIETFGHEPNGEDLAEVLNTIGQYVSEMVERAIREGD